MPKVANKSRNPLIKWVLLTTSLVVLVAIGFLGYKYYEDYRANKVYSSNETITFPDFKLYITKAEFNPVTLPLSEASLAKYGGIDKQENCKALSKKPTWDMIEGQWYNYGPSDYNVCVRRNNSRDVINEYTKSNNQLVVNYKISALNNVDTKDLKMELIPESGRELLKQEDIFAGNQFFREGGAQYVDSVYGKLGAPGPVYTPEHENSLYEMYQASKLGKDINKGLERTGYIYADIRKSESSVDLKVTYKGNTRLVRITR